VFSAVVFWPSFAGVAFLILGLVAVRRRFAAAAGLDKLIVLGTVFVAAPLATFGAEHLTSTRAISQGVPSWMPAHLFWTYFVAFALLAAALSLDLMRYVRWSAPLLAAMFFVFVLTIHLPNVVAQPHNRILWAVMLRDTSFGAGALALAQSTRHSKALLLVARTLFAVALIFFGVEHFLHPQNAPGVPLPKLMPAWVPAPYVWASFVGTILVVAGAALLINRWSRVSAAFVGLTMTVLTVVLYMPILCMDRGPAQLIVGVNYVADTLLFGGAALLMAMALRNDDHAPSAA